ncbi:MAG TPA: DMT family transporter [Nitrosopumilaceae archaeon]|nr:DMT family transporter [Nitrosopumilaceae archaeon]
MGMGIVGISKDIVKGKSVILALVKKPKIKNSKITLGFFVALLAAAFAALPNVVPKSLMEENSMGVTPNPLMLVFAIYVINGLLFTPIAKNKNPIRKLGRTTLFLLIILGLAESAGTLAYTVGLQETSALNASILVNGETIFAILVGITLFRERLGRNEILPFGLIFLGAILLPIGTDLHNHGWEFSNFVFGDILIILSGFFYCLDTFIAKKIDNSVSIRRIVHMMACGGAILSLGLMILLQIPFDITLEQFSIISIVGFLGIGVNMLFFVMALRLIGAVRTVLIYSTTTIFSVIYSSLYLSEQVTMVSVVSVFTVMFGLVALRKRLGQE